MIIFPQPSTTKAEWQSWLPSHLHERAAKSIARDSWLHTPMIDGSCTNKNQRCWTNQVKIRIQYVSCHSTISTLCFIYVYVTVCMSTKYNPWILHIMMIDAYMMNDVKSYRTSNILKSDISWLHSAEIHPFPHKTLIFSLNFRCFLFPHWINQSLYVSCNVCATFAKTPRHRK